MLLRRRLCGREGSQYLGARRQIFWGKERERIVFTSQNQQFPKGPKTMDQAFHDLGVGRRGHDQRRPTHLLQRFSVVLLAPVDVIGRTQLFRERLFRRAARQRDHSVPHLRGVLDRQMAQAAEALDRNDFTGSDLHLAHAVEDGDAGAEKGCVGGWIDVGRNTDGGF